MWRWCETNPQKGTFTNPCDEWFIGGSSHGSFFWWPIHWVQPLIKGTYGWRLTITRITKLDDPPIIGCSWDSLKYNSGIYLQGCSWGSLGCNSGIHGDVGGEWDSMGYYWDWMFFFLCDITCIWNTIFCFYVFMLGRLELGNMPFCQLQKNQKEALDLLHVSRGMVGWG